MIPSTWETIDVPKTDISRDWINLIWKKLSQPLAAIENIPLVSVQKRSQTVNSDQIRKLCYLCIKRKKNTQSIKKLLAESGVF